MMRLPRLCALLLSWVLCAYCAGALAQDVILERAVLEDPAGQWTLADVQSRDFTPYQGVLQRGFSPSVFWLRLALPGGCTRPVSSGCGDPWILRIQPGNLDEIAVYDSIGTAPQVVGDRHPVAGQPYRSLNHNVRIPAGEQPRRIWLRLQTTNTKLIDVQVLPLAAAVQRDLEQGLTTSLLITALFVFFVWSALHWAMHRDTLIGLMSLNQFVVLAYGLAYLGYIRLLVGDAVPPTWQDQLTNVLVVTAVPSQVAFHRRFLRELQPSAFGMQLLGVLLWIYPLELLGLAASATRVVLQLNATLALVVSPIFLATAWSTRPNADAVLSRGVLMVIYTSMIAMLWVSLLPILGLHEFDSVTVYSLPLYGFLNGLILIVILQVRAARLQALHQRTSMNLQLAQHRVEDERRQRRLQTQFMDMLTHELKTPLAVLRMAWGLATSPAGVKARADRAIQDMALVIDRCAQATALDGRDVSDQRETCNVAALLVQIAATLVGGDRIRLAIAPGLPVLQTDPPLLRSVLGNLLDNALKYAAPGTAIDVQARRAEDGIAITVANLPGRAGWPDAEQVFLRYYRSAAAQYQSGSGLGLYLAGTLAQRLGGVLHYAPDETHVRFELWLPL